MCSHSTSSSAYAYLFPHFCFLDYLVSNLRVPCLFASSSGVVLRRSRPLADGRPYQAASAVGVGGR